MVVYFNCSDNILALKSQQHFVMLTVCTLIFQLCMLNTGFGDYARVSLGCCLFSRHRGAAHEQVDSIKTVTFEEAARSRILMRKHQAMQQLQEANDSYQHVDNMSLLCCPTQRNSHIEIQKEEVDQEAELIRNDDCIICLNPLARNADSNSVARTQCHHLFHAQCLGQWLRRVKYQCPVCRQEL